MSERRCPLCQGGTYPVLMAYLPHHACRSEDCMCIFGWPSPLTQRLPWSGMILLYDGTLRGYIKGVWFMLRKAFKRKGEP